MVESGEMKSQEHESPAMARLGHRQFWYEKTVHCKATGVKDRSSVESNADLSRTEYDQVANAMRGGIAGVRIPAKPKRKAKATEPKKVEELSEEPKQCHNTSTCQNALNLNTVCNLLMDSTSYFLHREEQKAILELQTTRKMALGKLHKVVARFVGIVTVVVVEIW